MSERKLTDRLQDCGGAWLDFGYEPDAAVCFEAKAHIEELEAKLTEIEALPDKWWKHYKQTGTAKVAPQCAHDIQEIINAAPTDE